MTALVATIRPRFARAPVGLPPDPSTLGAPSATDQLTDGSRWSPSRASPEVPLELGGRAAGRSEPKADRVRWGVVKWYVVGGVLLVVAGVWFRVNGPVEGRTLVSVTYNHGFTVADIGSVVLVLVAGWCFWTGWRRGRGRAGASRQRADAER